MDTQGIFDDESSMKDCVATFAISMMVSSVQCFNVMQQVQEDDLQHLDMFTEYAQLVMQHIDGKAFQKLLFILRDWPHSDESGYGDSPEFVGKLLKFNAKQTSDMRGLRERLKSSFDDIDAFLLPHPGLQVSKGRGKTLSDIDDEFIEYVKELASSLLAPDKLIVKVLNGEKWKLSDFVILLTSFVKMFNDEELPKPHSMLMVRYVVPIDTQFFSNSSHTHNRLLQRRAMQRFTLPV